MKKSDLIEKWEGKLRHYNKKRESCSKLGDHNGDAMYHDYVAFAEEFLRDLKKLWDGTDE